MTLKNFGILFFALITMHARAQHFETIHLHTDKEIYLPGETIWFKAYLLNRMQPGNISSNFFVGLYGSDGKLLAQKFYPIAGGSTDGTFQIPDSTDINAVQLRATTANLLLLDSSFFYSKIVGVYQRKYPWVTPSADGAGVQLQVVPEAGSLVAGVPNFIYAKASENNKPASITAVLREAGTQKIVDTFETNHFGMGSWQFTPSPGIQYYLSWGNGKEFLLPAVSAGTVKLHSEVGGGKLYYSIFKKEDANLDKPLLVTMTQNGEILYRAEVRLKNNNNVVSGVSLSDLPPGIIALTVKNADSNIVQYKRFFNRAGKQPILTVLQKDLQPKGKTVLELSVPDSVLTNLSVSVSDLNFFPGSFEHSIYDDLLFASGGFAVADMISTNDEKSLDVLLNTSALHTKTLSQAQNDDFITLKFTSSGASKSNAPASLIIQDRGTGKQFFSMLPTSEGFTQAGLIFYDSATVFFRSGDGIAANKSLQLQTAIRYHMPEQIAAFSYANPARAILDSATSATEEYLAPKPKFFNEVQTITGITLKSKYANPVTKRLQELDDKYATGMFKGLARGYAVNVLDDPSADAQTDIFSYIQYRVPGLSVSPRNAEYVRTLQSRGGTVALFIDEMQSEYDMLENLRVSRVTYIKYVPGIVIGSFYSTSTGAIYIYTRRGNESGSTEVAGMQKAVVLGYSLPEDFKAPDYSTSKPTEKDFRSTLYWNPYLLTETANSRVTISYYNNDVAKKHLVVVRGFTNEGKLVELVRIIE